MNLTITDLLSVKGKPSKELLHLAGKFSFNNVSTDSRTIKKGDLFIALRGEKFDGHDYLDAIANKGVLAAIVDEKWFKKEKKRPKIPLFIAKNTLEAMGELARIYRRNFETPILVIAGSNGKTTTKELVAHVLGTSFNVLKTEANFNNQVGVPQMLFRLRTKHEVAVLEIGTNHPGEIAWLTNVIEPTHALITNIGREHLEFFGDLRGVAKEETSAFFITELFGGFAFINNDDPYLKPFEELFQEWSISFGTKKGADITAKKIGFTLKAKLAAQVTIGKKGFRAETNILADYAPNLIAAATAVGLHFNIPASRIRKALESFVPHSKRMEIVRTKKGITIINDTYNANPESFASALATLAAIGSKAKKYVVAGDMFELGKLSTKEHSGLGARMAKYSFAGYFFIGSDMKKAHSSLLKKRRSARAYHYKTKKEILSSLRSLLAKGDTILVKGSRGMRMEEIVEELRMTN